ncbi:MipA/OmpV family protein [Methylobacterium sp. J-076]|uniref:MipA/OmpV family protein n=1 Tax=Methylobacterium sp. J-076 TaxID=2836655 RepID=UPI001FB88A7A|nr:MipA/OmpV family protein [Methylobacterium sp. J-076]MCJ2013579.1 MipA/OmpV family protein [Methylobacterium sp. J-076]
MSVGSVLLSGARAMVVALPLALAAQSRAVAADLVDPPPARQPAFTYVDPQTWEITLSGTLQAIPRYPGASEYASVGYPGVDIHRAGEPRRFSAPDDNFSFTLYDSDTFRVGPTLRYVPGRYYGDDRKHLFGFRDARIAFEPGLFVEVYPVPSVRLRGEIRQGVYGHHGAVGTVAADYLLPFDRWLFSVGPRFNIGDASFAQKYFGVSPIEAAINGRVVPYSPGSFYAAGLLAAVTFRQSETWSYTAFGGYSRILGASGESPLVDDPYGNPNQLTFGLQLDYTFKTQPLL